MPTIQTHFVRDTLCKQNTAEPKAGTIPLTISIYGAAIFATIGFVMLAENLAVGCASIAVATVFIIVSIQIPKSDTLYEVTVDESVSYHELLTRYEVVSERGQIITVREKERKDDTE